MNPSLIKTLLSVLKTFIISLYEIDAVFISPNTSFIVKVNFYPSFNFKGSVYLPILISGPFVSIIHGIVSPNSFSIFLKV